MGQAALFRGLMEVNQIAEIGLNVLLVQFLLCHGNADYRRSGRMSIIARLLKSQSSFPQRHISVASDDDVIDHLDAQQLPRLDAVTGDDDIFRRG